MNSDPVCIGVDVGTSAIKVVAVNTAGTVVAQATSDVGFDSPKPGWAEANPDDWWKAACCALRQVMLHPALLGKEIASVGVAGQMHGLVVLDSDGAPLRPAIMWNDQRTAAQVEHFDTRLSRERVLALTGNRMLAGFTAPKWLWLREHEPRTVAATSRVMLPKDYVRFRLSGCVHTDVSDASGTLFFDCEQRRWSSEMCAAIELPLRLLPEVFESATITSKVNAEGARASGLPEGTPIAAGAGDQAAQAVGTGIVNDGQVSCTIGTSGVIFAPTSSWRPTRDGSLHAFCHAVPNAWHLMGVTLSAGGSLRWMRDTLCTDLVAAATMRGRDPYELMLDEAASAPAEAEGLVFLPYLSGERTPRADPNARGVFAGLSVRTNRSHMIRAVVEGITCSLRETLDVARQCGVSVERVRLSGGGARSAWWRQLLADAFDAPVSYPPSDAGAALGAALIAGAATGLWSSVRSAAATQAESAILQPSPNSSEFAAIAERYARCAQSMAPWFASTH